MTPPGTVVGSSRPRAIRSDRISLSLGAGGVRGIAHVLAIEAVDELGLHIDSIAGTSIGAVIGALRAAGLTGSDIRPILLKVPAGRRRLALRLITARALNMRRADPELAHWAPIDLRPLLAALLPTGLPPDISALPIPFLAVATDLDAELPHDFVSGPLIDVLAASSASPGLMRPVRIDGRLYVDGAVLDPVPVRPARAGGIPTIAVDLTGDETGLGGLQRASPAVRCTHMVLRFVATAKLAETRPALVLRPAVHHWKTTEFHRSREIMEALASFKDECKRAIEAHFRAAS